MILITGGSGLVGSHLMIHLLESGDPADIRLRAIYRNSESIEKTSKLFDMYQKNRLFDFIEWVPADITDIPSLEKAFQGVQYVYHCAGMISFDPADEDELRKINIEGTANIVNFSLANEVKKLCFVSSIAALGDLQDHEDTITEETEWNPEKYHSDYAIAKYGAEMEIWRGQQEGLQVVIINPGVIIGPFAVDEDWKKGSGRLFSEVSKGLKYYTKGTTGFIGVHDVVKAMVLLMRRSIAGERFIAVSENVSFEELTKGIAHNIKAKVPNIYAKKWFTEIAWRLDWILENIFFMKRRLSRASAKSLHTTDNYDNEKIKNALNFEFTAVETALKTTAAYFNY